MENGNKLNENDEFTGIREIKTIIGVCRFTKSRTYISLCHDMPQD